ncbi:MAG: hypothetical protein Rhirs2KO_01440 [Rhizobiaceae bacterium]
MRLFLQRLEPLGDDLVIGAARPETEQTGRRLRFKLRRKLGQMTEQLLAFMAPLVADRIGQLGEAVFHAPQLTGERLRQRQAEHAEHTIGLDLDEPLCQRAGSRFGQSMIHDEQAR